MSLHTAEIAMLMAAYAPDTVVGDLARDLCVTRGLAMALLAFFEDEKDRSNVENTLNDMVEKARARMSILQSVDHPAELSRVIQ